MKRIIASLLISLQSVVMIHVDWAYKNKDKVRVLAFDVDNQKILTLKHLQESDKNTFEDIFKDIFKDIKKVPKIVPDFAKKKIKVSGQFPNDTICIWREAMDREETIVQPFPLYESAIGYAWNKLDNTQFITKKDLRAILLKSILWEKTQNADFIEDHGLKSDTEEKGKIGELITDLNMFATGCTKIPSKLEGNHGADGIYISPDKQHVFYTESKFHQDPLSFEELRQQVGRDSILVQLEKYKTAGQRGETDMQRVYDLVTQAIDNNSLTVFGQTSLNDGRIKTAFYEEYSDPVMVTALRDSKCIKALKKFLTINKDSNTIYDLAQYLDVDTTKLSEDIRKLPIKEYDHRKDTHIQGYKYRPIIAYLLANASFKEGKDYFVNLFQERMFADLPYCVKRRIKELEQTNAAAEKDKNALNAQIGDEQAEIENLKERIDFYKNQTTYLKERKAFYKKQTTPLKKEIEVLKLKIAELAEKEKAVKKTSKGTKKSFTFEQSIQTDSKMMREIGV